MTTLAKSLAQHPVAYLLTALAVGTATLPGPGVAQDPGLEAGRRVVALSALAAKEYADGVRNGTVASIEEVAEARLFLREARRAATGLPSGLGTQTSALLDSAAAVVDATGPTGQLTQLAGRVETLLREGLGPLGDGPPSLRPSHERGRRLFLQHCTECHGDGGAGDGFRAPRLDPPPADLTDATALADQSPLDHFRKIRLGVAGTDMDGFEDVLDDDEIWAVAWYITRLRSSDETRDRGAAVFRRLCPGCEPPGESGPGGLSAAPASVADPQDAAAATDDELATMVRRMGDSARVPLDSADTRAVVQYLRTLPLAWEDASGAGRTFALTHTQLSRAIREARAGNPQRASALVFDAYAVFEEVEADVRLRDPALVASVEAGFGNLRGRLAGDPAPGGLAQSYRALTADLQAAQEVLEGPSSTLGLFLQSFVLLLREGLEAILIVGALATVVARAGVPERRRDVWWGAAAALAASAVTAVLLESVFRLGIGEQEALEGIVMLAATAVLLSVSYWLLAKVEVRHWKEFVTTKARRAVTSGSMLTLAGAAFLAVYREGFETVLFYKALFITAEGHGASAIAGGGAAAAFCLMGVYWGITYAGLRIPMRAFFGTTSAILFYMAFTFAGKGIAELQESRLLNTTLLEWAPTVPWMGIYPTVQTTVIQVGLLGLLLVGVVWTFVMHPRRLAARVVLERGTRDR